MKKIRKINDNERDILLKGHLRGPFPLLEMFYVFGILLPFLTCMIITGDFAYLYIFMIGLIILVFVVVIYPLIYHNYLQTGSITCFESKVLSCEPSDLYYYDVMIEGLDNNFLDVKYPVYKKIKKDTEVVVVMLYGKRKTGSYLLIDTKKNVLLSSKKTRYDLVE